MTQPAVSMNEMHKRVYLVPEKTVVEAHEMRDYLDQGELERIELRRKNVQSSWRTTGCSVLIDGWKDGKERDLINVLVECPQGPIYLWSSDISASMKDSDALVVLFGEIIEAVGADNVVQIISSYTLPCMKVVGKLIMEKYPTIFWTVSSSHCIELMLEKMATMDSTISDILKKARHLTKFIYSRPAVVDLMRSYTSSSDLIKSTKVRAIMPFLTLENIVLKKENLEKMFSSSEWSSSACASSVDGKSITDLVSDASFWADAYAVLKATIPLVNALCLIQERVEPQLGYLYDTLKQAKENIKKEFHKNAQHRPSWEIIDEIRGEWLHSPLHSAAYYLNPLFRYSEDFCSDPEISSGAPVCISNMIEDRKLGSLIFEQYGLYVKESGPFGLEEASQASRNMSPVEWWKSYGKECPELQSLAIRILSQTCEGASKYHLNRGWAEKLLTKEERNETEQELLTNQTFVNYNVQLEQFKPGPNNHYCSIDPMDDWVVGDTFCDGDNRATTTRGEGPSCSTPRM